MAATESVNQHLQMMIQKRSRCEDWVASVALQEEARNFKEKSPDDLDIDYDGELSEVTDINQSVKRRVRKTVDHQKVTLNLVCEWSECDYVCGNKRLAFADHVTSHVRDVAIANRPDKTECYQCLWENCNFTSTSVSEIKRHVNYHSYHTILKAAATELHNTWEFVPCTMDHENKNWLPDLSLPFECNVTDCNFSSDYFSKFLDHVNSHVNQLDFGSNGKTEVKCIWKGCIAFKCRKRTRMKIHMKTHTGEKTLACPTCGALFTTNTKYMDHCNRKAPDKNESNRCQYCLRYFSNERLLRDHMRYHINSHKCSFCEITCSTPAVLSNHVRYRHLNERPFKCNECPYTSIKADDCNAHMATHVGEPRFQCQTDGCNFSCRAVVTFKKHFKTVHMMEGGSFYCCHLCNKKYNRGPLLGNHLRRVHKLERPPGHSRFRYMEGVDGQFRLQVERYESLELNNADSQITLIDEQKPNFVIKHESPDEMSYQKITVYLNENDEDANRGALIAIDEVDEKGRIIKTSHVREKLVEIPTNEIAFIEMNEQPTNSTTFCDKKKFELTMLEDTQSSIVFDDKLTLEQSANEVDLPTDVIPIDNSSQKRRVEIEDCFQKPVIFSKRRSKKMKVNLSDADCVQPEIVLQSDC